MRGKSPHRGIEAARAGAAVPQWAGGVPGDLGPAQRGGLGAGGEGALPRRRGHGAPRDSVYGRAVPAVGGLQGVVGGQEGAPGACDAAGVGAVWLALRRGGRAGDHPAGCAQDEDHALPAAPRGGPRGGGAEAGVGGGDSEGDCAQGGAQGAHEGVGAQGDVDQYRGGDFPGGV